MTYSHQRSYWVITLFIYWFLRPEFSTALNDLKIAAILLPLPLHCQDYKCAPTCSVKLQPYYIHVSWSILYLSVYKEQKAESYAYIQCMCTCICVGREGKGDGIMQLMLAEEIPSYLDCKKCWKMQSLCTIWLPLKLYLTNIIVIQITTSLDLLINCLSEKFDTYRLTWKMITVHFNFHL